MDEVLLLKALADNTRLRIIKFLMNGEKCVCEIIPNLSVKQSATSTHLGKLEKAGIIKSRKDGKKIYYSISNIKAVNILKALGYMDCRAFKECCCKKKGD